MTRRVKKICRRREFSILYSHIGETTHRKNRQQSRGTAQADIFRDTLLCRPLFIFKTIYYASSIINWRESLASRRQCKQAWESRLEYTWKTGGHARGRSAALKIEGRVEHQPVPGAIIPNFCPMQDISKYFTFAPLPSITTAPI